MNCYLIQEGSATIFVPEHVMIEFGNSMDNALQIIRPSPRTEVDGAINSIEGKNTDTLVCEDGTILYGVGQIYQGCLVGAGLFLSKASLEAGLWVYDSDGARCPYAIRANKDMQVCTFSIDLFETLFGTTADVLAGKRSYKEVADSGSYVITNRISNLSEKDFKLTVVLGKGSFGTIAKGIYKKKNGETVAYALKYLFKSILVKSSFFKKGKFGQLLDEKNLLMSMESPFVVSFVGSFQTPNALVIVTEILEVYILFSLYLTLSLSHTLSL